ncbi:hypothetical protein MVEN_00015200 [Mycena venus]|uniref:Uncharacterized protein n=1 Tax=Mycena venus TaxID=2733690 RepID=A0A8H6Z2V2_9AGAR|nr:hypothetical protein MVEN_00015200 [Mycena venus]
MHWKLYAAIGRFLPLDGLRALYKFALHYQQLSDAAAYGIKVFYGTDRQPWKRTAEKFGYTKYSRHNGTGCSGRRKNDGRPPDTGKALIGPKRQREPAGEYEKFYRWKDNSCRLDSSLTIISVAVARDYSQAWKLFFPISPQTISSAISARWYTLASTRLNWLVMRLVDRDGFRFNTMFGWLCRITDYSYHLPNYLRLRKNGPPQLNPVLERACCYFRMVSVKLKFCTGSSDDHWQLSQINQRKDCQLNSTLCEKYGGDMRKWFQDLIRVTKSEPLAGCWHTREGVRLCDGSASEQEVILNLPVVLIIEMGDTGSFGWNIPAILSPYASNPPASVAGVKYSIVGHIYSSIKAKHFIVRYLTIAASKKKVFDYDGMKHEGHSIRDSTTSTRGTLTGPSQSIQGVPAGYLLYVLVYHLDGGETAQQFFRKEQLAQAEKLGLRFEFNPSSKTGLYSACEFRRRDVVRIPDDDRFWLVMPTATTVDYILDSRTRSPKKAVRHWHAPMARSSGNNTSDSSSTEDLKLRSSEINQPEVISILSDGEEANDDEIT